jgi:hypothetical protein
VRKQELATMPAVPRFSRFIVPVAASLALGGGGLAQVVPAHADFSWCFDDPVISINGQQVTIQDAVYADATTIKNTITGSTITLHVPKGVTAKMLSSSTPYYHEVLVIVADGGSWTTGQPINATAVLTFQHTKTAAAVQAQMLVTTPTQSFTATGTSLTSTSQSFTLQ